MRNYDYDNALFVDRINKQILIGLKQISWYIRKIQSIWTVFRYIVYIYKISNGIVNVITYPYILRAYIIIYQNWNGLNWYSNTEVYVFLSFFFYRYLISQSIFSESTFQVYWEKRISVSVYTLCLMFIYMIITKYVSVYGYWSKLSLSYDIIYFAKRLVSKWAVQN